MLYTYRIDCWVPPKSGFDLARQNKFFDKFKSVIKALFSDNQSFQIALDTFGQNHEGMVLDSFIIETDKLYEDNKTEILSKIEEEHPGAIVISCKIVDLTKV
jgi:hypothetical protein